MADLGFSNVNINAQANLNLDKPATNKEISKKEKTTVSSLQLTEKLEVSNNTIKGNAISNLDFNEKKADSLPAVTVREAGELTYYTNAYGKRITALKTDDGISYNTFSDQGLSIILKDNKGKRDVLVFSAMTDKVPNNSSIHDNYFHVNADCDSNISFKISGKCDSKIYFDKEQNIVIELNEKNKLILNGKDAQTILEGPFKINFNPDSNGDDFNVNYTGTDKVKRFTSHGGNIKF